MVTNIFAIIVWVSKLKKNLNSLNVWQKNLQIPMASWVHILKVNAAVVFDFSNKEM